MQVARPFRLLSIVGTLVLAIALLGCAAGCATSSGATTNQQSRYVVTGGGVVTTYSAGHRQLAPEISGKDLSGKPLSLAQFKGKVIVLNFWASWCPPCRSEASALAQVSTETASLGVQFVGVDIRENSPSDGVNFVETHDITYPNFADQSARIALAFRGSGVSPETPPSTLVIDRTGHVAARGLGAMSYGALKSLVTDIAHEPAASEPS